MTDENENDPTDAELREAGKKRMKAMADNDVDSYRSLRFELAGGKDRLESRDG